MLDLTIVDSKTLERKEICDYKQLENVLENRFKLTSCTFRIVMSRYIKIPSRGLGVAILDYIELLKRCPYLILEAVYPDGIIKPVMAAQNGELFLN